MLVLGGLGSILGSFLGAIFVYGWPIFLTRFADAVWGGGTLDTAFIENNSKDYCRHHYCRIVDLSTARICRFMECYQVQNANLAIFYIIWRHSRTQNN